MMDDPIPQGPIQESPKPQWKYWVAAGGCFILLCGAAFIGSVIIAGPKIVHLFVADKIQLAEESPREVTQKNTMGDPNAPVYMIEYGDFQCPYCLNFWNESEHQLIEEYVNTDKVYFEYRSFPILGIESGWASEGAYCAGDQGNFWEYHDMLFTNWTGENVGDFTKDKLIKYAEALNLNMEEFEACISEEKHKGTVEKDKADGEASGVTATPTFFINGVKIEGAQPYSVLKKFIEQALDGILDIQSG